jgi:hypothetical protein
VAFLGFDASFSNVGVGVGGVDGFYGSFPEVEPVGVVVDGHEDVVGDFVADGGYVAEEPTAKAPGKIKPPVKPVDERVDDAF